MTSKDFDIHGSFSINREDNILIVHAEGPGNIELAEEYHTQMKAQVAVLKDKPWATLNIFSRESFFPPDASQALIEGAKRAKDIGFVACAFIVNAEQYQNSMKSFWEMIYVCAGVTYKFFEDETEAMAWLKERLIIANAN